MSKIHLFGRLTFAGFLTGLSLALALGHWTWFAMRINTSIFIPIFCFFGALLALWNSSLQSKVWFLISEFILAIVFVLFYWRDFDALLVIPGILLREGFMLNLLNLQQANFLLISVILTGNLICFIDYKPKCEIDRSDQNAA